MQILTILTRILHTNTLTLTLILNTHGMITSTLKGTSNPDVLTNIETGRDG